MNMITAIPIAFCEKIVIFSEVFVKREVMSILCISSLNAATGCEFTQPRPNPRLRPCACVRGALIRRWHVGFGPFECGEGESIGEGHQRWVADRF